MADHHYVSCFYFTAVDAGDQFVLTVEDACGAFEAFAFLSADLGYAAAFGEVAI